MRGPRRVLLLLLLAAGLAAAASIELRPEATVVGASVRLGHLAAALDAEPALAAELAALEIARLADLKPLRLEAAAVQRRLAVLRPGLVLRVQGATTVRRAARRWSEAELLQAAAAQLPPQARLASARIAGPLLAPLEAVLAVEAPADPWGETLVLLRAEADGRSWARAQAVLTVERPVTQWVAARDLARGERLAAGDLRPETRWLRRMPPAVDPAALVGRLLRRSVAAGELLTPQLVLEQPLVRAGSPVTALWPGPGFVIELQAVAAGDARPGERVAVRRPGDKALLTGTVLEDGRVQLAP